MHHVINEGFALGMIVWSTEHLREEFSQQLQLWSSTKTLTTMKNGGCIHNRCILYVYTCNFTNSVCACACVRACVCVCVCDPNDSFLTGSKERRGLEPFRQFPVSFSSSIVWTGKYTEGGGDRKTLSNVLIDYYKPRYKDAVLHSTLFQVLAHRNHAHASIHCVRGSHIS